MATIKKYINFRVTTEEHRAFQALVDRLKRPLGTWAREVLLREMGLNPKLKDLLCAEVAARTAQIPKPVPTAPTVVPDNIKEISDKVFHQNVDGTARDPIEPKLVAPPDKDEHPMSISSTTNEAEKMDTPPKPIPAIDRMYQIILKRDGKEAADNWRRLREPVQANIPPHLKPFYDRIVETQGKPAGDFWLLTQSPKK